VLWEVELEITEPEKYPSQVEFWLDEEFARTKLLLHEKHKAKIFPDVLAELVGFGSLQPLLNDPDNSEIMVYGPNQIYVERYGKLVDVNIF